MTAQDLTRARDHLDPERAGDTEIELAPLLGTWVIFDPEPTGLTRLEIEAALPGVRVRAHGSGENEPPAWGTAIGRVVAENVGGGLAQGFRATFDHGFQRVEMWGYLNRGVLAVDSATTFTDGSPRSPYLTRALFYRP